MEESLSKEKIIKIVSERFEANPRVITLFDPKRDNFAQKVQNLINYCYHICKKLDGIYVSSNQKTIIFFYYKKDFRQSYDDYLRYAKMIFGIPCSKLWASIKREKLIKKRRPNLENYIYVWFLAQEKTHRGLGGLIEIQNFLFTKAMEYKLDILLETSNPDLIKLYERAGFKIYHVLIIKGEEIFFLTAKVKDIATYFNERTTF